MSDHGQGQQGHKDEKVVTVDVERFTGGGGLASKAAIIGVIALAATFVGMRSDPKEANFAYLLAFIYWAGIGFTSLVALMIFHAFRAKWMTVVRRPLEGMALSMLLFGLLFIPVVLGMSHTFSWVNPSAERFDEHAMTLLHNKHGYLNQAFFVQRAVAYFLIAVLFSHLLFGWSNKQDTVGGEGLLLKQRKLSTVGMPFIALALTFAAFDWVMSLDPLWFSTIFGVYIFGGGMLSTLAVLILVTIHARGKNLFGDYVTVEHLHNLGKLLFAFTAFWGYIGVSQLILIWIAGLPDETPFYIIRMREGWAWVGLVLLFGHFFIPFFALLSRARKRNPKRLRLWAAWALLMHFFDLYWLVFPNLNEEHAVFHWTIITAWIGIGGLAVAFVIKRLQGKYMIPIKDPYLSVSLRYRQP